MTYSTKQSALCAGRLRMLTSDRQSSDGLTYTNLDRIERRNQILAELLKNSIDSWLQFEIVILQVTIR
jgi:hypothetical protein